MSSKANVFDDLLTQIACIDDHNERDSYILKNKENILKLSEWLSKTIVSLSKNVILDSSSEEKKLYSFCLECLLHISSALTPQCDNENKFCELFANDRELLKYLNETLYMDYGTPNHAALLVNLSRFKPVTETLNEVVFSTNSLVLEKFLTILCNNKSSLEMKMFIANYFINLTHCEEIRMFLITNNHLKSLLKIFEAETDSKIQKSIVNIFRNCCFNESKHPEIFSSDNHEFIVKLTYPLAGPEEFDEEDNASLPVDLQYLPIDKNRHEDSELRKLLLEVLLQCCATRYGRKILRNLNIYLILREYHKWETNSDVMIALENLIDILIKTEDELENIDNLKEVIIPDDVVKKFESLKV